MTAYEAVTVRKSIEKLCRELRALAQLLERDKQFRQSAAVAVNDADIIAHLQDAAQYLDAYDTILCKALDNTVISEVSLT